MALSYFIAMKHFLVLLTFIMLTRETTSSQCLTEHNIPGMALKGHTFKKSVVKAPYVCDFKCEQHVRCQSYNYVIQDNVCELNSQTKEEKPEYFVRDPERFYIKRLSTVPRKGRCCKGTLSRVKLQKFNSAKTCLHHWKPFNSGPGFLKITIPVY